MAGRRQQLALEELVALFERNGVLRLPNRKKREKHPRTYKKGYEIRFMAHSEQELQRIQHLLRQAKLNPVVQRHPDEDFEQE